MYSLHPSIILQQLFKRKPYQGQDPMKAKFIFIGLDTNYAIDIENDDFFEIIIQYHEDSVAFWNKYNIHHPVLMDNYQKGKHNKDGRKYHQNFAKIGIEKEYSQQISFVELLDVPTVGVNRLAVDDLNKNHLEFIDKCLNQPHDKIVFVSSYVLELMRKTKIFIWTNKIMRSKFLPLDIIYQNKNTKIIYYYHFSSRKNLDIQAKEILKLVLSSN